MPPRFVILSPCHAEVEPAVIAISPNAVALLPSSAFPAAGGDLCTWLPSAVAAGLPEGGGQGRCLMLLDARLPDSWHQFPWEALSFAGRPLPEAAVVVRRAAATFLPPAADDSAARPGAWLNLFPREEFDFAGALTTEILTERLHKVSTARYACDPGVVPELMVFAHGGGQGLLKRDGSQFDFGPGALPDRIWLLACNKENALWKVAEGLLQRGVRTVVVATGDLSAPQMAGLAKAWLAAGDEICPANWLQETRSLAGTDGGAAALTVYGSVVLDRSPASFWNERLFATASAEALPGAGAPGNLADDEFADALTALDSGALWPEAFHWLYPQVLGRAENLDHRVMQRLFPGHRGVRATPELDCALATRSYRLGDYRLMASFVVRGLASSSVPVPVRAELLGLLAMLLIDMDMPDAAEYAVEEHGACPVDAPEVSDSNSQKRLDWLSRLAFRRGPDGYAIAIQRMAMKRERSCDSKISRELSWLLYMASWATFKRADPGIAVDILRDEALARLRGFDPASSLDGNNDANYLLRAVACHAAMTRDDHGADELRRWLPALTQRLASVDPGPWAFSALYLRVAGIATGDDLRRRAMSALEDAGYLHEAAAFSSLLGDGEAAEGYRAKFVAKRKQVLAELASLPEQLRSPVPPELSQVPM